MSFLNVLDTVLIGPLKLVFEIIFSIANRIIGHPGLAIIVLSLIMNILVLPLYRRADAMQEEARDIDLKLKDGIAHIKKTFSGNERMMILQAYYQQNNYSPLSALKGSVSLLLEIPFFMAAYQFLSDLSILDGVSLGPITDLGKPDGLIVIWGGLTLNLLPILMTIINVISSYIYLKGFPLKTKIQLYAMALFFLFFLYESPACLVFYWTLNNLFSLVKTVFYKIKNPKKVLEILTFVIGIGFIGYALILNGDVSYARRRILFVLVGIVLLCPAVFSAISKKITFKKREAAPNSKMFLLGSLCLAVLSGLLIPSTFIAASPQEYVDITYFHNPLWYIVSSACLAVGIFLVWMRVFYWLASPSGKEIFDKLVWILSGAMLVNYMFFGTDLGVISSSLQYENELAFTLREQLINLLVLTALGLVLYFIAAKFRRVAVPVLLTLAIALVGMSVPNVVTVQKEVAKLDKDKLNADENLHLSKDGKNVVVFMLDRAMGQYIPFFFNENPKLKEQFEGFTYYKNVISHGGYTNFGTPSLLGGYEYTPVEMNRRDDKLLKDKQNEAIKVMPVAFLKENFEVTVCDPPYANYQWIPDLSIFNDLPKIRTFITEGKYSGMEYKKAFVENNTRNFFCFSIMKGLPLTLQPTVYNKGLYNKAAGDTGIKYTSPQTNEGLTLSTGVSSLFMNSYTTLEVLPKITDVKENKENTFLFISNAATHEPQLLQLPNYTIEQNVDNRELFKKYENGMTVDGITLKMDDISHVSHYHANMASLMRLGDWFDYMRENNVFDNTRIVIAADHGRGINQIDSLKLSESTSAEMYYPLLMVKDFGSTEFSTSDTFMTTADVPSIAMNGLIKNPKNPFTGKPINTDEKTAHDQFVSLSDDWDINMNNGTTFKPSRWASVKDNMLDRANWKIHDKEVVLTEHKAP